MKFFVFYSSGSEFGFLAKFEGKEQALTYAKEKLAEYQRTGKQYEMIVAKAMLKVKIPLPDATVVPIE